ncbi:hypothetical protein U9M48_022691, partial [Paspalum notatum var. saurae]
SPAADMAELFHMVQTYLWKSSVEVSQNRVLLLEERSIQSSFANHRQFIIIVVWMASTVTLMSLWSPGCRAHLGCIAMDL